MPTANTPKRAGLRPRRKRSRIKRASAPDGGKGASGPKGPELECAHRTAVLKPRPSRGALWLSKSLWADNRGYHAPFIPGKVYRLLPDPRAKTIWCGWWTKAARITYTTPQKPFCVCGLPTRRQEEAAGVRERRLGTAPDVTVAAA